MRLRGEPLQPHPDSLVALLDDAARRAPDRPFIVERAARDAQRTLTFARAAELARTFAGALAAAGTSQRRPLLLVAENGIEHALVSLAAFVAGTPVVPLPPHLAREERYGFANLRRIVELIRPGAAFVAGPDRSTAARAALGDIPLFADVDALRGALPVTTPPAGGESIAKVMLTSGADGEPLGVVTTHAMLCAQQQALAQAWPFLAAEPPRLLDVLPWHRALGGNLLFGLALRHAGTLYAGATEIVPTVHVDVPSGWSARLDALRADDALRARWLAQVRRACWSEAVLASPVRDGLRALGFALGALWGATQTCGPVAFTTESDPAPAALGEPLAGVELKLEPHQGVYEARVRGAQVMPGYWWQPERSASAFDDEGFYRSGDAVRATGRGIAFSGRLDERFKLASGAWVRAGQLRRAFLTLCPDAGDALADGAGRASPGLLVWLKPDAALLPRDLVRAQVATAMRHVAAGDRSPGAPRRALILDAPLPADERARAGIFLRLYASEPDADVIVV